jgi:DNA-binding Lrp family transcriptional regulator
MTVVKKRNIRRSVGFNEKEMEGYFMIAKKDAALTIVNKLTGSQLRLWLYLMMIDSFADSTTNGEKVYHPIPSPREIAIKIGASPETVEKDIRKLKKLGLDILSGWSEIKNYNNVEQKIRDRLKDSLGGLAEVSTPAGRIDLLTNEEIIEVKRISDWKAALGQILVYSAFYPEHQKRLHLFGRRDELTKVADIEAACLAFNVNVTTEEV